MKGCDACCIGGAGCDNEIYKTIIDGCGLPITYCKEAWERGQNEVQ